MSANSNCNDKNGASEPSLSDLFALIKRTATSDQIDALKEQITTYTYETNEQIQQIKKEVAEVKTDNAEQNNRIEMLEINMEIMKQDRLKNNICISGVPVELVNNMNVSEIIVSIGKRLGHEFSSSLFNAYTIANNRFILVHFYNIIHKQTLINKIRVRKSLMVEEVFGVESNSQIYLNDHLTPYFNNLYLIA